MNKFKQAFRFYWRHREAIIVLFILLVLALTAMILVDILINKIP